MTDQRAIDQQGPEGHKPLRFEDYRLLTHKLARQLAGWMKARGRRGAEPSHEDITQDLAMIWVLCRDRFDPSLGVKFSTYYTRAALNHWAALRKRVDRENITMSFDEKPPEGALDNHSLSEVLADPDDLDPEEVFARREWAEQVLKANPLLARLMALSADPPQELRGELAALAAQRIYARSRGIEMDQNAATAFTPKLLGRMFRFNWRQYARSRLQAAEEAA